MIGGAVVRRALARGLQVRGVGRRPRSWISDYLAVGDIGEHTDWREALQGVDAVIHAAGLAHVADADSAELRRTNVLAVSQLARACAKSGVRRLVFLSTAKVHGERTEGKAFCESDLPAPEDPYAASKWEAEQRIWEIGARASLEVTVVRSPLVYGPEVKANFLALLKLVDRGMPLPFGAVRNERSLIFVENLADLLVECARSPLAAAETFLAAEGPPVSTPRLVKLLAEALRKPARLVPIPPRVLRWLFKIAGRADVSDRLLSSFAIDGAHARERLGWAPPTPMRSGIETTCAWYRETQKS
ncbi:MAG: NAD-dependent epimerase/dehydratase family protein [Gemmatimonadota bacterium]|nr:NAD-dependent epimerase/dehydratase family protein [Gemmatimonadota bacterium]